MACDPLISVMRVALDLGDDDDAISLSPVVAAEGRERVELLKGTLDGWRDGRYSRGGGADAERPVLNVVWKPGAKGGGRNGTGVNP